MSLVATTVIREPQPACPAENWYAAYTCVNQERKVAERLDRRGIEFYLPLYRTLRRRSDRRVALSLPLFPGYVFVHLSLPNRAKVLEVPSVVRLVGPQSAPVALPPDEIERLRKGLSGEVLAEPCRYLTAGCRVRVVNGPFEGCEAVLLRRKQGLRAAISLDLIMRSFTIEVGEGDIERI
jgi:transcription antitermination factor NusG